MWFERRVGWCHDAVWASDSCRDLKVSECLDLMDLWEEKISFPNYPLLVDTWHSTDLVLVTAENHFTVRPCVQKYLNVYWPTLCLQIAAQVPGWINFVARERESRLSFENPVVIRPEIIRNMLKVFHFVTERRVGMLFASTILKSGWGKFGMLYFKR